MTRGREQKARMALLVSGGLVALLLVTALVSAAGWWSRTSLAQEQRGAAQTLEAADEVLAKVMQERTDSPTSMWRMEQEPPFDLPRRTDEMFFYPCSDCHAEQVADFRVRELEDEHFDLKFEHGEGRFWCYDACHNADNPDRLVTLRGRRVTYDASYKVCGQCHQDNLKDWYFGAHGKPAGAYNFPRDIPLEADNLVVSDREEIGVWGEEGKSRLNCPFCHEPHAPAIQPFEPSPPPMVRKGLEQHRVEAAAHEPVWTHINRNDGADH